MCARMMRMLFRGLQGRHIQHSPAACAWRPPPGASVVVQVHRKRCQAVDLGGLTGHNAMAAHDRVFGCNGGRGGLA